MFMGMVVELAVAVGEVMMLYLTVTGVMMVLWW